MDYGGFPVYGSRHAFFIHTFIYIPRKAEKKSIEI